MSTIDFAGLIISSKLTTAQKRIINIDFCNIMGYSPTVYNSDTGVQVTNPQNREEFFNEYIMKHIKDTIMKYRRSKAREVVTVDETDLSFEE